MGEEVHWKGTYFITTSTKTLTSLFLSHSADDFGPMTRPSSDRRRSLATEEEKSAYEILRDTRVAQMAARLKPVELALIKL
jgi:hypothetical protein